MKRYVGTLFSPFGAGDLYMTPDGMKWYVWSSWIPTTEDIVREMITTYRTVWEGA